MATLKISIIGTDKILYEGEAEAVFVPTKSGIIEVLPEHMQLVSALQKGEIILKTGKSEEKFKISGGVIEIRPESKVIVLADIVKE